MMHPTFGEGEVTGIIELSKIDILFAERIRRLIQSTSSADPIPAADRTRLSPPGSTRRRSLPISDGRGS